MTFLILFIFIIEIPYESLNSKPYKNNAGDI